MHDKRLSIILLLAYTFVLVYALFWGLGRETHTTYLYNLTPFSTINHYITTDNFSPGQRLLNVVGNIVAFIPFGLLIPLVFKAKLLRTVFIFLLGLFILESLQLITKRGVFDVDDFFLNTLGALMGYILFKTLWRKPKS